MGIWEYNALTVGHEGARDASELFKTMNEWGADGWELVAITTATINMVDKGTTEQGQLWVFKRSIA